MNRIETAHARHTRQLAWIAAITLIFGFIQTILIQPYSGQLYEEARVLDKRNSSDSLLLGDNLHIAHNDGQYTYHLSGNRQKDGTLKDVLMIRVPQSNETPSIVFAQSVSSQEDTLIAIDVRILEADSQRDVSLMALSHPPASLIEKRPFQAVGTFALWQLPGEARRLHDRGYDASDHLTTFHQMLAQPWFYLASALTGAALGFRGRERIRTDRLIFAGAGFAIGFYFINALLGSFGSSGWIAPAIAGWFPASAALSCSAWLILRADYE